MCPWGRANASNRVSSRRSMRTARMDTRQPPREGSCPPAVPRAGCASTRTSSRPSCRTTSRRNAAFRVFDSTITSRSPGDATRRGIAGEPPPDPTSSRSPDEGRNRDATSGSMTSLSSASSSSPSAVRLTVRFQWRRRVHVLRQRANHVGRDVQTVALGPPRDPRGSVRPRHRVSLSHPTARGGEVGGPLNLPATALEPAATSLPAEARTAASVSPGAVGESEPATPPQPGSLQECGWPGRVSAAAHRPGVGGPRQRAPAGPRSRRPAERRRRRVAPPGRGCCVDASGNPA